MCNIAVDMTRFCAYIRYDGGFEAQRVDGGKKQDHKI